MNRIWVRLSLAFTAIVLVTSVVMVLLAALIASNRSNLLLVPQSGPELLERLVVLLVRLAVLSGVLGVLFGIAASRRLIAPLERLANAARAIGSGDLGQRVEVSGADELVAVATAFNNMAESLKRAETLRRNLTADVAHELRTPLSVLQANLQALLDGVFPLESSEISRLYDQTRLLGRLVDDLHELAQMEAGQLPLTLAPIDLAAVARDTATGFAPVAEINGVRLDVELPESLPSVQADAARMTQVLHNLLSNALRHTPAGGSIAVQARANGDGVVLTVADTGYGVRPDELPFVFDRFYRADPARSRERGGVGLGLSIARALVEAHGGTIGLASDGIPGHGTTATVRLPVGGERPVMHGA